MARNSKPIAKEKDTVLVLDKYDDVFPCTVYQVKMELDGFTARGNPIMNWHYYVKPVQRKKGMPDRFVVRKDNIAYVATYTTKSYDLVRHYEFLEDMPSYENMMDYLHSLPKGKRHGQARELIALVEACALLVCGDRDEVADARNTIESILS